MTTRPVESPRFVHAACFYHSDEHYLEQLVPFLTEGLAHGNPVAAMVPAAKLALLRHELGSAAARVHMVDMAEAGRNPGRIIAGMLRSFADEYPDRGVRIVGEPVWPGRTEAEYPACAQYEALVNRAFAGRDATLLCPYDASGLGPAALTDARTSHPVLRDNGTHRDSVHYAPAAVFDRYNQPFDATPDVAGYVVTSADDLHRARRFATDYVTAVQAPTELADNLALIATELVTNSLIHADGSATLRLWHDDDHLICEVRDGGQLHDPLAGHRPPAPGQPHGRGLLMIHHLADLVRQHTTEHGTTIRAYLRHPVDSVARATRTP